MRRKASFASQAAKISSAKLDYYSDWTKSDRMIFTTVDAHNFSVGTRVTILDMASTATPYPLLNASVVEVPTANSFKIQRSDGSYWVDSDATLGSNNPTAYASDGNLGSYVVSYANPL
jgi:hypothetical protein